MTSRIRNVFDYLNNPAELESVVKNNFIKPGSITHDQVGIAGNDDWLYLYKGSNDYYKAYLETATAAEELSKNWEESINGFLHLFKSKSIKFAPVIVPNKASIIPEYYPLYLKEAVTPRLKLLRQNMGDVIYCPIDELRSSLFNAMAFRRLDTHMTEYGNLYFVSGILKRLGVNIKSLHLPVDLVYRDHSGDLGSRYNTVLAEKVARFKFTGVSDVKVHDIAQPISANTGLVYESRCIDAPINAKLIVFGNSFFDRPNGWSMAPYFCRIFRIVRFYWESGVYEKYIDEFKPDFAIFQTCERFLSTPPRIHPFSAKYYNSINQISLPTIIDESSMKPDQNSYFNIVTGAEQAGEAFIFTHPIGTVGPGIPFPVHQLVNFEEDLKRHGITIVSKDGLSVSRIDVSNFVELYLSEPRLIDRLQSSIAPGKWALWAYRPKKDGFVEVDFGIVLPIKMKGKEFVITCEGQRPIDIFEYYDKHLGSSHWFMPNQCVIGMRCRFKLERLTSYLLFKFEFVDSAFAVYSKAYRPLVTFTDTHMLDGLPDIERIQRVASKNANKNSFLNGGRTSYLAIKAIAESEHIDFNKADLRVLDWGVGCGRVARHFLEHQCIKFTGIDIDVDNLNWCRENLSGSYLHVEPDPPSDIPANSFDLIYSCSVLSHLTEVDSAKWLNEIARVLSTNGVALLSYNGSSNSASYLSRRPAEFLNVLNRQLFDADVNHELDGFIPGKDYYRASFASDEWWLAMFEKYFDVIRIEYSVVNGYQHIAVLRKKDS
jgi:SAM-dependent methyltransferase